MAKTPRKQDDAPRSGKPAPKGLSEEDLALWRQVTQSDVRLPGRDYVDPDDASEETPGVPTQESGPASAGWRRVDPAPAADPVSEPGQSGGVDKRTAQRLRRGQLAIEASLDLHGMTQAEAHRALNGFLADAQASAKRCVIVITGKGRPDDPDSGVLRRAVPQWLDQSPNRGRIIAVQNAQPRHGGGGALYVLLRKPR